MLNEKVALLFNGLTPVLVDEDVLLHVMWAAVIGSVRCPLTFAGSEFLLPLLFMKSGAFLLVFVLPFPRLCAGLLSAIIFAMLACAPTAIDTTDESLALPAEVDESLPFTVEFALMCMML